MRRFILVYFAAITIPAIMAVTVWQAEKYHELEMSTETLVQSQEDYIESSKRLLAGIAVLSSPERIEYIARNQLKLEKLPPEDVLQVRITDGDGN